MSGEERPLFWIAWCILLASITASAFTIMPLWVRITGYGIGLIVLFLDVRRVGASRSTR